MATGMTAERIVEDWFGEEARARWFNSTPEFDARLARRYQAVHEQAARGELDEWQATPAGSLALVILLDQIPLNIFRGQPRAFATEAQARTVAAQAIDRGQDRALSGEQKVFLYMPYMHSESLADQDRSVRLYEQAGLTENLKYARHHRDIVARFGRFPHRNAILGRQSTREEIAWLASDGAFTG